MAEGEENHLRGICREICFEDQVVLMRLGEDRRMKIVVHRRLPSNWKPCADMTPEEERPPHVDPEA